MSTRRDHVKLYKRIWNLSHISLLLTKSSSMTDLGITEARICVCERHIEKKTLECTISRQCFVSVFSFQVLPHPVLSRISLRPSMAQVLLTHILTHISHTDVRLSALYKLELFWLPHFPAHPNRFLFTMRLVHLTYVWEASVTSQFCKCHCFLCLLHWQCRCVWHATVAKLDFKSASFFILW